MPVMRRNTESRHAPRVTGLCDGNSGPYSSRLLCLYYSPPLPIVSQTLKIAR